MILKGNVEFTVKQASINEFTELVGNIHKYNILIAGSMGSGKTELSKILLNLMDRGQRNIVICNYSNEYLQMNSSNYIHFNNEGYELSLKKSLKLNPDRVLLDETRLPEDVVLLSNLASVGKKVISTMQATSRFDAFSRYRKLGLEGLESSSEAAEAEISKSIDVILFVERVDSGPRQISIEMMHD
ncbi:ATPase, T2SS/T4P/T4SS family [Pseudobacillus sp. 179-B 2D1 NHS]|uniref:ATPase, T2SS/T4P/T4SS family n=1 Tax=Pseudobacillus sp. 179-B 2D1 NHS TaxID=3374292 RepID=UPI0038796E6D